MLFSLANQFNTYTSPLLLHAGFGSSVLNGTRHSRIVLLTYSEDKKCLCWSKSPIKYYHQINWSQQEQKKKKQQQHIPKKKKKKKKSHFFCMWRCATFLYFWRGNYISESVKTGWRFGNNFFIPPLNLALDRIAREKAICVWLLSLASPEPGWAWASKCQSDKDQAWQTDTGVLSFRVSSLC